MGFNRGGLLLAVLLSLLQLPRTHAQAPAWQQAIMGVSATATGEGTTVRATTANAQGDVFLTGFFSGVVTLGRTVLRSRGGHDVFVAKWSQRTNAWAWAVSGGGRSDDEGVAIAVNGAQVYITGSFDSQAHTVLAGTALVGAGATDMFVAKYSDWGTRAVPGWAVSGGGGPSPMKETRSPWWRAACT